MNLIKYEFIKILGKKSLWVLVVLLLAVNTYLFVNEKDPMHSVTPEFERLASEYNQAGDAVAAIAAEQEYSNAFVMLLYLRGEQVDESEIIDTVQTMLDTCSRPIPYDELIRRYSRWERDAQGFFDHYEDLRRLSIQAEYIADYPAFIASMEENAKTMQSVSIFNDKNSFAYRNIIKTPKDFAHLQDIPLSFGNDTGLYALTRHKITDYFLMALLFLLCIFLFSAEKENRLLLLLRTNKQGRLPLVLAKLFVLLLTTLAIAVVYYGGNIVAAGIVYGLGDAGRLIQSMSFFRDATLLLTAGQFLWVFLLTKLASIGMLSLIFALIFVAARNAKTAYLLVGAYLGGSIACTLLIQPLSPWNALRHLNIFTFLDTAQLYGSYVNLDIFGHAVSRLPVSAVVAAIVSVGAAIACCAVFCFSRADADGLFPRLLGMLKRRRRKLRGTASLFRQELYKAFVINKVYIFILAALYLAYGQLEPGERLYSQEEYYYVHYAQELSGPIGPEKTQFIEGEQARLQNIGQSYGDLRQAFARGEIDEGEYLSRSYELDILARFERGFQTAKQQYDELLAFYEETGVPVHFISTYKSDYIFSNWQRDLQGGLVFSILLTLCLFNIFPYEHRRGMMRLVNSAKHGRERLYLYKSVVAYLAAAGMYAIAFLPAYYNLGRHYLFDNWGAPIQSIAQYRGLNGSILSHMVLAFVSGLVASLAMAALILLLSKRVRHGNITILLSCLLFSIPFAIGLLDVDIVKRYTLCGAFNFYQNTAGAASLWPAWGTRALSCCWGCCARLRLPARRRRRVRRRGRGSGGTRHARPPVILRSYFTFYRHSARSRRTQDPRHPNPTGIHPARQGCRALRMP